jgi:hypothetical protein
MPIPPYNSVSGPRLRNGTPRLCLNAAILGATMGDSPDFQTPDSQPARRWKDASDWVDKTEPQLSKEEQQELAHGRNRICKARSCVVCAPLREARSLKKKQRKTEAQALLHDKGQPCGRTSCVREVCVAARSATPAAPPPVEPLTQEPQTIEPQNIEPQDDPARTRRREDKRHLAGVPCGSENCVKKGCIVGFTNERTRRHRARRPCRAEACDNPICVTGR